MSRKPLLLALVLGLVTVACSQPSEPQVDLGSGQRFVALVADPLNDAGRSPSVVVGPDGGPIVAYFGFSEDVPEGTLPATRPVGAPPIPGVLMATVNQEGIWTRGAMAMSRSVPSVSIAFNPAVEETLSDLVPAAVTGLQAVVDGQGDIHAVWGTGQGLFYANGSSDPGSTTRFEVTRVVPTPPVGPSIAVDGNGAPWIAYATSTSTAASVQVATPQGDGWVVDGIADAAGCATCATAVAVVDGAPTVAYTTGGNGVSIASNDGENGWVSQRVAASGGQGLSATPQGDGLALSYYVGSEVHVATGPSGGPLSAVTVSTVADDSPTSDGARTSIAAADDGTLSVAWYDQGSGVAFATGDGSSFSLIGTGGDTAGGSMPSVAVTPDGSVTYLSWYDERNQDLLVGAYGDLGELALALPSPTPGASTDSPSPPPVEECTPAVDGEVTIVAEGIAFTDGRCIEVPAGEPFTIHFDNRDVDVQHNVQIFSGSDDTSGVFFPGEIITGPTMIDYQVDALDAGEYFYNCVVHPATMTGTVNAVEGGNGGGGNGGGGGGGGGATLTVTAKNIAFDTSEIALPAGEPSTILFVNDDPAVPHNIAIYTDATLSEELFNGDIITGPSQIEYEIPALEAGEYYFVCVVHPNMNGSVVVS